MFLGLLNGGWHVYTFCAVHNEEMDVVLRSSASEILGRPKCNLNTAAARINGYAPYLHTVGPRLRKYLSASSMP